jgi:hypothetical protein
VPEWAADVEARLLKGTLSACELKTLRDEPLTSREAAGLTATERRTCFAIFCARVRKELALARPAPLPTVEDWVEQARRAVIVNP